MRGGACVGAGAGVAAGGWVAGGGATVLLRLLICGMEVGRGRFNLTIVYWG